MAVRKPKIVVVKEDFGAAQVAEESVANVVKAANIMNAVDTMASDFMPDEKSVLHNDELGLVFTELTDAEAKSLMGKAGVEAIEDDERVYALQTDEPGLSADDGSIDADLLEEDLEASAEINEDLSEYEDAKPEDFELITPEVAAIEAQRVPEVDDFDIGDNGEIISFDDTTTAAGEAATGIPRDKLVALVKCIIKCALETTSGQVVEVSDEKISEILGAHGASGGSATVQAVRDYITCGLKIIYAPPAWRYSTGAGVRVAVVDTGIAPRHPDLRVYGGASFVPGVTRWHDDHGHGTHVAGTIAATANGRGVIGVAPAARLYAVKVLNSRGSGRISGILNGLAWCLRYRMHVVNLSLGSEVTTHDPRVYSRAYETAARRLRRAGILPVAASGNSGRGRRPFVGNPGRCPSFMAVGAVDCSRRRAPFSSYGPQVEICAPGVGTWSTVPPNRYGQKSGTSMACPHVAGVAALVKRRRPAWSGDAIRVHMRRTALDLGTPGRDWFYGYGQVRAWHAVR